VAAVAPGVCAAAPVELRGGGFALPAERERARRDRDETDDANDDKALSDAKPEDANPGTDAKSSDAKAGPARDDADTVLDADDRAPRAQHRRHLDRHG
jgi:hypothetical protein